MDAHLPVPEVESRLAEQPSEEDKPQGLDEINEAAAPLATSQSENQSQVASAVLLDAKSRLALGSTIFSAWIFRIRESFKRVPSGKTTGGQSEVGPEEEATEPGSRDFNPLVQPVDISKSSQEIFNDLGQELRQRREMLSLTIEEVERHIHVRATFLRALERGAMEELPSLVQTRGMFLNYAAFLDLDVDALLLRFADGLQVRHRERHPQKPGRARSFKVNEKVPPLSTFIAGDLLIGGGMIVLLILFTVWGVSRVVVMRSQYYPQVTAPAISNILAVTLPATVASQEVTLIPAQDTPATLTPAATATAPTLPANINVELNIVAVERTYMRVTVDGVVQFDGQAMPGTAYPYEAKKQVEVLVGSASGLSVTYNGRNLGLMGTFGQVVDNVYTAQGVLAPTATPLPTKTATPRFSPTPTATPTLAVTPTSGE